MCCAVFVNRVRYKCVMYRTEVFTQGNFAIRNQHVPQPTGGDTRQHYRAMSCCVPTFFSSLSVQRVSSTRNQIFKLVLLLISSHSVQQLSSTRNQMFKLMPHLN